VRRIAVHPSIAQERGRGRELVVDRERQVLGRREHVELVAVAEAVELQRARHVGLLAHELVRRRVPHQHRHVAHRREDVAVGRRADRRLRAREQVGNCEPSLKVP